MATFSNLTATWDSIASTNGKYPLDMNALIDYIKDNVKPSGINSHAVTVVDLKTNHYLYIDDRIEQVTGYTKEEYAERGPRFMFSKIPLSHKFGVIKSSMHQNRFVSALSKQETKDFILFREINVYDKEGNPRRILHQVLEHVYDDSNKIRAVISLQTKIDHINLSTKFKYYIYSKSKNKIIYPKQKSKLKDLFTPREKEIIIMVSEGLSSNQIAAQLFLSLHTVKTHRRNILRKSKSTNFIELISSLNT